MVLLWASRHHVDQHEFECNFVQNPVLIVISYLYYCSKFNFYLLAVTCFFQFSIVSKGFICNMIELLMCSYRVTTEPLNSVLNDVAHCFIFNTG